MDDLKHVIIYTDGACLGNPGPGGYGALLLHGDRRQHISGGYRLTTNNRMEIMAAIAALDALRFRRRVTLYSDSQYVVNAMSKGWARKWRTNGWMRNKDERAVNPDLWERLLQQCERHDVEFKWVRGHAGIDGNERADRLSMQGAQKPGLPPDIEYEKTAGRPARGSRL